jgi:predicted  nucleic acid-binding Zn-ribbon protein
MQIEAITLIIGSLASILTALVSYIAGKKKATSTDFDVLIKANEQFRSEIRNELAQARQTIEELRQAMKDKDKEVSDLQNSVNDLQTEIVEKDRRISDLKIDLMKKDIRVSELAARLTMLDKQS